MLVGGSVNVISERVDYLAKPKTVVQSKFIHALTWTFLGDQWFYYGCCYNMLNFERQLKYLKHRPSTAHFKFTNFTNVESFNFDWLAYYNDSVTSFELLYSDLQHILYTNKELEFNKLRNVNFVGNHIVQLDFSFVLNTPSLAVLHLYDNPIEQIANLNKLIFINDYKLFHLRIDFIYCDLYAQLFSYRDLHRLSMLKVDKCIDRFPSIPDIDKNVSFNILNKLQSDIISNLTEEYNYDNEYDDDEDETTTTTTLKTEDDETFDDDEDELIIIKEEIQRVVTNATTNYYVDLYSLVLFAFIGIYAR